MASAIRRRAKRPVLAVVARSQQLTRSRRCDHAGELPPAAAAARLVGADAGRFPRRSCRSRQEGLAAAPEKVGPACAGRAELFRRHVGSGDVLRRDRLDEVASKPFGDGGCEKALVNFTDIGVVSQLSGSAGWCGRRALDGKPLAGAAVSVRYDRGKVSGGDDRRRWRRGAPGNSQLRPSAPPRAGLDTQGGGILRGAARGAVGLRIFVRAAGEWTMGQPRRAEQGSRVELPRRVEGALAPVKRAGSCHTDFGVYSPGEKVTVKGLARVTKIGEPLGTRERRGKDGQGQGRRPDGKTIS